MNVQQLRDARWRRRLAIDMAKKARPVFRREFRGVVLADEDFARLVEVMERFIDEATT